MEKQPYHHGDLRAALVQAGLRLLADRTVDALSLREVARTVGVSATAVYRHFPNKEALLGALARDGLERLAAAQHIASDEAGGGRDGFAATGLAYVRFALDNPALFHMIFASPPPAAEAEPAAESEAFAFLHANARGATPKDAGERETAITAIRAWSLVHGLAMLMLDGQVPADQELIDLVVSPAAKL